MLFAQGIFKVVVEGVITGLVLYGIYEWRSWRKRKKDRHQQIQHLRRLIDMYCSEILHKTKFSDFSLYTARDCCKQYTQMVELVEAILSHKNSRLTFDEMHELRDIMLVHKELGFSVDLREFHRDINEYKLRDAYIRTFDKLAKIEWLQNGG